MLYPTQLQACNRAIWNNAHPRGEDVSGGPGEGGKGGMGLERRKDETGDPVLSAQPAQMGLVLGGGLVVQESEVQGEERIPAAKLASLGEKRRVLSLPTMPLHLARPLAMRLAAVANTVA